MASYAELQSEPWWGREIVTAELSALGDALCASMEVDSLHFGDKGNNKHLRGAHRSQEWIKNSKYCTNRSYTVQSGLTLEQTRHIAGCDFQPGETWGSSVNRLLMRQQTGRLIDAMRAGQLNEVRQLFGTLDGKTVTGWDNVRNVWISADNSHLDHWHGTIDRRYLRNIVLMQRIHNTAIGVDDMPLTPEDLENIALAVWNRDVDPSASVNRQAWRALDAAQKAAEATLPVATENGVKLDQLVNNELTPAQIELIATAVANKIAPDMIDSVKQALREGTGPVI